MSENCTHCGARLSGRWERLTPGLVRILIKFKKKICEKGENAVNVNQETGWSHTELANFQKLRFHGLVAKVRFGGDHVAGFWLLTRRGNDFLKGYNVPPKVFIFRNRIEKRCEDELVTIQQILKSSELPTFDEKHDFKYEDVQIPEKPSEPITDFFN